MTNDTYRYAFEKTVKMQAVEESLLLAVIATEGLHGRVKVNLDARFTIDDQERRCEIDADNDVGKDLARIFTGLLVSEMGEGVFKITKPTPKTA